MPNTSQHSTMLGGADQAPSPSGRPRLSDAAQGTKAPRPVAPLSDSKRAVNPLRLLPVVDVLAVTAAWVFTYALANAGVEGLGRSAVRAAALGGFAFLLANHARLYDATTVSDRRVEAARVLRLGAGTGLLVLAAPVFTQGSTDVPRAIVGGLLSILLVGTGRFLLHAWLHNERAAGRHLQSVAVIGYGDEADRLVELIAHRPDLGLRVVALAGDRETSFKHGLEWIGWPEDAVGTLNATGATGVVMSPAGMPPAEFNGVAQGLARRGVKVYCSTGLKQVGHGRLQATALANESFYSLASPELTTWQLLVKRALDLSITSAVLVLSAPVMLAVAVAIKLSDRGPILFRQVRVGRHGKPFTVFKFRTMVVDAEARLIEVQAQNVRTGPLFKAASDPRITRIGRLLRATSLDELPQLLNVMNGTVSLVGPRPALPAEVATFDERHLERHKLPPGMTGLWQVEARDNPSFQAYQHLDVFYVENWSVGFDLVLLWTTLPAIATRALRSLLNRGGDVVVVGATGDKPKEGNLRSEPSPEAARSAA
jgi:exopolysaccharide biosynthesis polyprenyl glycosylphosphotransferase